MMKVLRLAVFSSILLFSACSLFSSEQDIDVSGVDYQLQFSRFDSALYGAQEPVEERLVVLRAAYPEFMNNTTNDFWIHAANNESQIRLFKEVQKSINFKNIRTNLNISLKHLYYYYPDLPRYKVFSYISGLDFYNPVYRVDTAAYIFVASDLYLGGNHPAYGQLDRYLAFFRSQRFMVSELLEDVAIPLAKRNLDDETFVNELIWWGKILYLKDKCMPGVTDDINLRFSKEHVTFCEENSEQIWLYFVKNSLLFDAKEDTKRRFIRLAPFSKFYTEFDNQTPGMIGKWFGLQIVRSYMESNPEVTLQQLMNDTEHQRIFTNSKYRP